MTHLYRNSKKTFLPAALMTRFSLVPGLVFGQNRTETSAATGQAALDGNGTISTIVIFPSITVTGDTFHSRCS